MVSQVSDVYGGYGVEGWATFTTPILTTNSHLLGQSVAIYILSPREGSGSKTPINLILLVYQCMETVLLMTVIMTGSGASLAVAIPDVELQSTVQVRCYGTNRIPIGNFTTFSSTS